MELMDNRLTFYRTIRSDVGELLDRETHARVLGNRKQRSRNVA